MNNKINAIISKFLVVFGYILMFLGSSTLICKLIIDYCN